jgi:hypothetical protein
VGEYDGRTLAPLGNKQADAVSGLEERHCISSRCSPAVSSRASAIMSRNGLSDAPIFFGPTAPVDYV